MMRFVGFALMACLPSAMATEILSLGKFKTEYATAVTTGYGGANQDITGASEPSTPALMSLWAWYRNVDASTKAEAQAFMDAKVAPASSTAVKIIDFSDTYKLLVVPPVTEGTVAAEILKMRAVLSATRPTDPKEAAAWDAYQGLDASDKAAVKDAVLYKPFVDAFTKSWKDAAATDFPTAALLASGTMDETTPPGSKPLGKDTNKFWLAMTSERSALSKVMFTGAKSPGSFLA